MHDDVCFDYGEICGRDAAKRALQIAAAGGHGILLTGAEGSGKGMLAAALPSILPPVPDLPPEVTGVSAMRPFCRIEPSAGEIGPKDCAKAKCTAAAGGVLFIDGMENFSDAALLKLRRIADEAPASGFVLVASTKPCPCGHYGDRRFECRCGASMVADYRKRIGGPLAGLFDLQVDVWFDPDALIDAMGDDGCFSPVDSDALRVGVDEAREYAGWRAAVLGDVRSHRLNDMLRCCRLGEPAKDAFEKALRSRIWSERDAAGLLSTARTVADMARSREVTEGHLFEALSFKPTIGLGGLFW